MRIRATAWTAVPKEGGGNDGRLCRRPAAPPPPGKWHAAGPCAMQYYLSCASRARRGMCPGRPWRPGAADAGRRAARPPRIMAPAARAAARDDRPGPSRAPVARRPGPRPWLGRPPAPASGLGGPLPLSRSCQRTSADRAARPASLFARRPEKTGCPGQCARHRLPAR